MVEGIVREWRKQSGDVVVQGDVLLEIETDKALFEVESPSAGTLGLLRAAVGETVPVGQVLVQVLEPGDSESDIQAVTPAAKAGVSEASLAPANEGAVPDGRGSSGGRQPHSLSPRQRGLLNRAGADNDESAAGTAAPGDTTGWTRDVIGAKVSESWRTIPHFAVVREIDATTLMVVLGRLKQVRPGITVTDLLVHAWAVVYRDVRKEERIDVGLAVATDRGVAVPVIRDVLALSASSLADARQAASGRARSGRLNSTDVTDPPATTVSNLGPQGVDWFTGIIPLGQTTLLTVGRIRARVIANESEPVVRQTLFATVNVDHRQMDGHDAARLLDVLSEVLVDEHRLEFERVE